MVRWEQDKMKKVYCTIFSMELPFEESVYVSPLFVEDVAYKKKQIIKIIQ